MRGSLLSMCQSHELAARSLWVSPLAYPNLFGTKGFVVVVVVVVSETDIIVLRFDI